MSSFFRFPHTPHIAWLAAGAPRDDKVLSGEEARQLLASELVLEEKLDGANLGFSVSPEGVLRPQNRGQYLTPPLHGQFQRLAPWLQLHEDRLFDALGPQLIAFGEWCAARHSLDYPALPDWWLLFDVYDRTQGRFWSTQRRDAWAAAHGFAVVPRLQAGHFNLDQLKALVASTPSRYREGRLEGVVLRQQDNQWLHARAKLVRADFTQAIESHWRTRTLEWNQLDPHSQSTPQETSPP